MSATYPANFALAPSVEADLEVARWRPFVQWLLALPHLIIANVLSSLSQVLAFISWFVILITGKMPKGIADLQAMCLRYQARAFSYVAFLRTGYPPFEFDLSQEEPGGDETVIQLPAQLEERNRLTVALRLFLLVPVAIMGIIWSIVGIVVGFVGALAILVTGRWPEGLRRTAVGVNDFFIRAESYGTLMRDDFPPVGI